MHDNELPDRTTTTRPSIPAALKREVLVEAGHRCGIPRCLQTSLEIAHIVPWADCKTHSFENLIALCPNCHTRYDRGEIDRTAMRKYKANLGVISSRYSEQERRLMTAFADSPNATFVFGADAGFTFMYLLTDGLVSKFEGERSGGNFYSSSTNGRPVMESYRLTNSGQEWIKTWTAGEIS